MDMVKLIEKKKWKQPLTKEEMTFFVNGAADASIPEYQLGAMLMAIRLNGMNREETVNMTLAMAHSGEMMDLHSIRGIPTDKHSTGGVGDTTTLVLAPLVAACGVPVAKMSGRGLGHTGGTLDKLESIPGLSVDMTKEAFLRQVDQIGLAVVGQTNNLTPADKTLYSLRDVTSTVDSMPLIASSIVSKKLASGAQAIVLDVKTGAGALMQTVEESIQLAKTMVRIGTDAGRRMVALVTDMSEPLGSHVGNALEVKEAIDVLSGRVNGPLLQVSLELGARMLLLGGQADSVENGKLRLIEALRSGAGLEKLRQMIRAQGGDPACCDDVTKLPQANCIQELRSREAGYIASMDTIRLGNAAQSMGAGRKQKTDIIDHSVGFVMHKRIGDPVAKGELVATLHAKDAASAAAAGEEILSSLCFSPTPVPPCKLIHAFVDSGD